MGAIWKSPPPKIGLKCHWYLLLINGFEAKQLIDRLPNESANTLAAGFLEDNLS